MYKTPPGGEGGLLPAQGLVLSLWRSSEHLDDGPLLHMLVQPELKCLFSLHRIAVYLCKNMKIGVECYLYEWSEWIKIHCINTQLLTCVKKILLK